MESLFSAAFAEMGKPSVIKVPTRAQLRLMADEFCRMTAEHNFGSADPHVAALESCLGLRGQVRDQLWKEIMFKYPTEDITTSTLNFTPFLKLPIELRTRIWIHSLEEFRIIEIIFESRQKKWRAAPHSQVTPPLLFVCKEANKAVRNNMAYCFGTWINMSSDIIWVNSLKYNTWTRYYSDFMQELLNTSMGEEPVDKTTFRNTAWYKVEKLMVTWELFEDAMENKYESFCCYSFSPEGIPENLPNLKELTLVFVEYIRDSQGKLYTDERKLYIEDIEEVWGARNIKTKEEIAPMIEKNFGAERQFNVEVKLLQRGDDGPGGARANLGPQERSFFNMTEMLVAEEKEEEDRDASYAANPGDEEEEDSAEEAEYSQRRRCCIS